MKLLSASQLAVTTMLALATFCLAACNRTQISDGQATLSANETLSATLDPANAPTIAWADSVFNFNSIPEGQVVKHAFTFTNTGKSQLIIVSATAMCGCTVPTYSKAPIPPGGKGQIDVEFNSQGKAGNVRKEVSILANTMPTRHVLYITGQVNPSTATGPER